VDHEVVVDGMIIHMVVINDNIMKIIEVEADLIQTIEEIVEEIIVVVIVDIIIMLMDIKKMLNINKIMINIIKFIQLHHLNNNKSVINIHFFPVE